jgi:hypothetical protein
MRNISDVHGPTPHMRVRARVASSGDSFLRGERRNPFRIARAISFNVFAFDAESPALRKRGSETFRIVSGVTSPPQASVTRAHMVSEALTESCWLTTDSQSVAKSFCSLRVFVRDVSEDRTFMPARYSIGSCFLKWRNASSHSVIGAIVRVVLAIPKPPFQALLQASILIPMIRLIVWIFIGLLALSFFGISLRSLAGSPTNQDNVAFLISVLKDGWSYIEAWFVEVFSVFEDFGTK